MADQQQNKPIQPDKKPPVDKKDIMVVSVWGWPRRLANNITKQFKHHKIGIIFGVLVAIVIVSAGIFGYLYFGQNRTVLQVGTQKISSKQYNQLINEAKKDGINKEQATKTIIESYKYQQAAQQAGIIVPAESITRVAHEEKNILSTSTLNDWQMLEAYPRALDNDLLLYKTGGYDGAVLFFPFDGSFLNLRPYTSKPEGFGTQAFVEKTKMYAKEQAKLYRQELVGNKITTTEAIEQLADNKKLLSAASANDSYVFRVNLDGTYFNKGKNATTTIPDNILQIVKSTKPQDVSDVQVGTSSYPKSMLPTWAINPVETRYYIVKVLNKFDAKPGITDVIDKNYKNIKVNINVKE